MHEDRRVPAKWERSNREHRFGVRQEGYVPGSLGCDCVVQGSRR